MPFIAIIAFALILSFLVIIHEIGHFLAAKWAGIKVEEFGLGYPPRALTLFHRWGTRFSLNWVPFGGFVKMVGEDGPDEEATKSTSKLKSADSTNAPFYTKSATKRLIVVLAGATVNVLFGVIAFSIVFSIWGIPSGAIVESIAAGSPAEQVKIPANVAITNLKIDGQDYPVQSSQEIVMLVSANAGREVTITTTGNCESEHTCEETTQQFTTTIRTPEQKPADQGLLGIVFKSDYLKFYPWYEMPFRGSWYGIKQALMLGISILLALKQLVSDVFTQFIVPNELTGPVGIVHQAAQSGIFDQGPLVILLFAGMLSINLGVMNVLPIPALDGGRAVFILLEKIIGKNKVEQVEGYANYAGFAFLIGMILLITARDIFRIFV